MGNPARHRESRLLPLLVSPAGWLSRPPGALAVIAPAPASTVGQFSSYKVPVFLFPRGVPIIPAHYGPRRPLRLALSRTSR